MILSKAYREAWSRLVKYPSYPVFLTSFGGDKQLDVPVRRIGAMRRTDPTLRAIAE
jgi:hypothetical protein